MREVLHVVAILVAGLLVGSELAIAAFVHPTLNRLPDTVHLPVASALARVLGRVSPFWYVLVFLLTFAEVYIQWHRSGRLPIWVVTSAILWALAILYSITALVPINNRIASWGKATPPANWKTFRSKWDLLHRWRVVLLTVAFAFLIVNRGDTSRREALAGNGAGNSGSRPYTASISEQLCAADTPLVPMFTGERQTP